MQLPFTSKPFIWRLNVGVKRRFQRPSSLEICPAFSLRANNLSRRGSMSTKPAPSRRTAKSTTIMRRS